MASKFLEEATKKFRLFEMQQEHVDEVVEFMRNAKPSDYPFNAMFGGKWRVVLPFKTTTSKQHYGLSDDDWSVFSSLINMAFLQGWKLNIQAGRGYKIERQTNPKTGEEIERTVEMRLGKVINIIIRDVEAVIRRMREQTDERYFYGSRIQREIEEHNSLLRDFKKAQDVWNKNSEQIMSGDMLVVLISQHPIDVLRMADFKGLESCHSQGGAYFWCALEEAQAHGPIAYLIRKSDYNKIKDRLQDEEVFADPERDIEGIRPVSRIRIREIYSDEFGSIPVVEGKTYGNKFEGFREAVVAWVGESEFVKKLEDDDKARSVLSFALKGGHYRDISLEKMITGTFGDEKIRKITSEDVEKYTAPFVKKIFGEGWEFYCVKNDDYAEDYYTFYFLRTGSLIPLVAQPSNVHLDLSDRQKTREVLEKAFSEFNEREYSMFPEMVEDLVYDEKCNCYALQVVELRAFDTSTHHLAEYLKEILSMIKTVLDEFLERVSKIVFRELGIRKPS